MVSSNKVISESVSAPFTSQAYQSADVRQIQVSAVGSGTVILQVWIGEGEPVEAQWLDALTFNGPGVRRWNGVANAYRVKVTSGTVTYSVISALSGAQIPPLSEAQAQNLLADIVNGAGKVYNNAVSLAADWSRLANGLTAVNAETGDYYLKAGEPSPPVTPTGNLRYNTVTAISDLKAYPLLRDNLSVTVRGYYTAGDGGGGVFVYSSSSSDTANDGTIILPNSGVGRWIRQGVGSQLNAKWFGAKGDGVTNDTARLQAAVDAVPTNGGLTIPEGTYRLVVGSDGGTAIALKSNMTLSGPATLTLAANNFGTYYMVRLDSVQNVTVRNLTIIGDKASHTGVTGEYGMGLSMKYARNIHVENVSVSYCWGDNIYLGSIIDGATRYLCENVTMVNVQSRYGRRQGMSIICLLGGKFIGCEFSFTSGTAPAAGVDIEPNNAATEFVRDIQFIGCKFEGNTEGFGFVMAGGDNFASNWVFQGCIFDGNKYQMYLAREIQNVTVSGCIFVGATTTSTAAVEVTNSSGVTFSGNTFRGNGRCMLVSGGTGLTVVGNQFHDNSVSDNIQITSGAFIKIAGNTFYKYGASGVRLTTATGPVTIEQNTFYGSNGGSSVAAAIRLESGSDVTIDGNTIRSDGTTNAKYAIIIAGSCSDVTLRNNDIRGTWNMGNISDSGVKTVRYNNRDQNGYLDMMMMSSPDGSRWRGTISNAGVVTWTDLDP